uniref:Retrovirus-related Pol polyprotein from transposon TNT 1-94 n=1 Tax=Tanacetum cinerariifolium TaxID=118510 RepID=A0A6L2NTU3_TANCI|nr:retrovirus-related Pol polyprotein from transposon TNT 1-94 [Tanacetum cinerariifolium]
MQTQTSNTLHNAIMEAGSKDRPPMLAPGWKEKFVPDYEGNPTTTTEKVFETYKNVTQEIRDQLNAEAEAVQIILIGIDNDIYSTVDACPNAREMWKAIERLKQGESINVQDLETNLFWEFGKLTSQDELLQKCKCLETELSKSKMMSKSFESVQKHAINLELELQQCKEKIKNDMSFKVNKSKDFCKELDRYFEIQDLKAQLQDKGIVIRVIPPTSVSRPQLKSNQLEDRVMLNNSQGKKQELEDHRRNVKFSKNKTSVTACNDSLNAKTSNVNFVCFTCGKYVLNDKHDMCVLHSRSGVNSRTKMPMAVPINTREPKCTVEQFVAKPLKRTVASESTNQKPRHTTRKLYEHVTRRDINLFIIDSGCSKHMTGNIKLLTNFVEKFLEGIQHQTSVARTPEQNGVVERRNRTLVQAARTMLSAANLPLFFWAEAIATACFTQNRSLVIPRHEKTPYHIINDRKPRELTESSTRVIMESIHVNFDELPQMVSAHNSSDPAPTCQTMASVQISSDPAPKCQTMTLEHDSLSPRRKCQENVSHRDKTAHNSSDPAPTCQTMASVQISSDPAPKCQTMTLEHDSLSPRRKCQENVSHRDKTGTTSNELDMQFSLMFDELLNGSSKVVSKSSTVSAADAPNQCQQLTTPLNNHITPTPTCQTLSIAPIVISSENINQAEPHAKNDEVADDEFINIFSTLVQDQGETSSRHVDSSNILSPGRKCQENVSHGDKTVTTLNELDLLLSPMFDELLNGPSQVVSKSFAVTTADECIQRQQLTTPLNNHTTPAPTCQIPSIAPTVISSENINQVEMHAENDQVVDDESINIFSTPVQD